MWYSSVRRLGASRAGLLAGVAPVAAAVTGVLLGGPAPRPEVWVGIAVVAAGLALGLRAAGSAAGRLSGRLMARRVTLAHRPQRPHPPASAGADVRCARDRGHLP